MNTFIKNLTMNTFAKILSVEIQEFLKTIAVMRQLFDSEQKSVTGRVDAVVQTTGLICLLFNHLIRKCL